MVANAKELNAIPVFGFEWGNCYCDTDTEVYEYQGRNQEKLLAAIPFANFYCGYDFIRTGIHLLSFAPGDYTEASEGETDKGIIPGGVDHPKTKGMALIARGVATVFFAGILFVLADAATTAGRALFRSEQQEKR